MNTIVRLGGLVHSETRTNAGCSEGRLVHSLTDEALCRAVSHLCPFCFSSSCVSSTLSWQLLQQVHHLHSFQVEGSHPPSSSY